MVSKTGLTSDLLDPVVQWETRVFLKSLECLFTGKCNCERGCSVGVQCSPVWCGGGPRKFLEKGSVSIEPNDDHQLARGGGLEKRGPRPLDLRCATCSPLGRTQ